MNRLIFHAKIFVNKIFPSLFFFTKDVYPDYQIGKYTYGHPKIIHFGEGKKITIGNFCSIADQVTIFIGGEHRTDWLTTYPFYHDRSWFKKTKKSPAYSMSKGDVIIGNDVWIGYGVTILSGVQIGDGAVIGARSVVTKDVEPYSIVAGNPAKEIRKRFSPEVIKSLLKLKWWDWNEDMIRKKVEKLCDSNFDKLKKE